MAGGTAMKPIIVITKNRNSYELAIERGNKKRTFVKRSSSYTELRTEAGKWSEVFCARIELREATIR